MSVNLDDIDKLLIDWETGELDADGKARLHEILKTDSEARRYVMELQMVNAALAADGGAGVNATCGGPELTRLHSPPPPSPFPFRAWMAAAAVVLVCLLAWRVVYLEIDRKTTAQAPDTPKIETPDTAAEQTSQGIALLTRAVDVEWGDDQVPIDVGDALVPGKLAIAAGLAQVEFFSGATVIIEGPAELDLKSPTLARVKSGSLRAQVPPAARGFSLEVDDMTVVDLGTEFALAVSADGASVQVFDGEVELHRPTLDAELLTAGQAVSRSAGGEYKRFEATPETFVDITTLESRSAKQRQARYDRWQRWSADMRRDRRLIAYYAFDQKGSWDRRLRSSAEPFDSELDGAIVGANRVSGRFPDKEALEFKRPGDRVRVQIPGTYESLTLACWVKIDSLDRWYNSLFLTDNYNHGEPHWQILDTGQLFFSVRHRRDNPVNRRGKAHHVVLSPPFWEPSMSGKWIHLATTYDVKAKRTTHYLNGRVLHSETIPDALLVTTTRIGAASLGNWSMPTKPDAHFAVRNLNGSMDEFAMFAEVLSAEEIKEMFEHGNP